MKHELIYSYTEDRTLSLFPPDFFSIDHSFDGCSAATHFALIRALVVIVVQPVIQISLKRINAVLELLAEQVCD